MKVETTAIRDVLLLTPEVHRDERGYFFEGYYAKDISQKTGKPLNFVQGNHSASGPHVLRGLHYQIKNPQGKIVRCLKGRIFNVAVDLRRSSETFGKWVGRFLDEMAHEALYVPPGFANGFFAQSEGAIVHYACSTYYEKDADRSIAWNDPDLGIGWPLQVNLGSNPVTPVLSQKDRAAVSLQAAIAAGDVFE